MMNTTRKAMALKQERFEAFLDSHLGIVFKVARTYCRQPDDQQDLIQEIKVQLWRAFGSYDEKRAFSTWMYRIALNTAISWTRRISLRRRHSVELAEAGEQPFFPEPTEEMQTLHRLIDELDSMNRAVLLLYLDDLSHAEIGEILGVTANHVATKISRLKQRLRQEIAEPNTPWN